MSLLVKVEHNVETGVIVEIPLTDQEIANVEKMGVEQKELIEKEKIAIKTKDAAKQAVLDKLGLSADEVAALLG